MQEPRVAIVHDWLIGGGAERVVEELHHLYPDAPIYTSYCSDEWRKRLDNKVVTGWLQHLGKIRKFLPVLRIIYFTRLDFKDFDFVISSSGNGEALGVKTPKNTVHINYCHAPTHFYWRFYKQYLKSPGFGPLNPLARFGLKILLKPLRAWDYRAAQRADFMIANSSHIQSEIKEFYGRESTVIHPPVDIERFSTAGTHKRSGYVTAARQVPQKRLDIIIGACNELNVPLTVIGRGPEHENLIAMAGNTVVFKDNVSDQEMPDLFASAEAFLFASYEDFGVTPVEAMATGTPVIAYNKGGARDYIVPNITGQYFNDQTVESLKETIKKYNPSKFDSKKIKAFSEGFSSESFRIKISDFVKTKLK